MTDAAEAIRAGQHDVAIAGGADSMSDVPLGVSRPLARRADGGAEGKTLGDKLKAFSEALRARTSCRRSPASRASRPPASSMGEAAEKMAKENGITPRGAGRDRAPLARRTPRAPGATAPTTPR